MQPPLCAGTQRSNETQQLLTGHRAFALVNALMTGFKLLEDVALTAYRLFMDVGDAIGNCGGAS